MQKILRTFQVWLKYPVYVIKWMTAPTFGWSMKLDKKPFMNDYIKSQEKKSQEVMKNQVFIQFNMTYSSKF